MTEDLNSVDTLFVAILAGGSSAEAEVSRNSAAQIQRALSQAGHSAVTIELDQHCAAALMAAQPDVVFRRYTAARRRRHRSGHAGNAGAALCGQ